MQQNSAVLFIFILSYQQAISKTDWCLIKSQNQKWLISDITTIKQYSIGSVKKPVVNNC